MCLTARLSTETLRASTVARDGAGRLVLHRWIEASTAPAGADLTDLAARTAAEFQGVE